MRLEDTDRRVVDTKTTQLRMIVVQHFQTGIILYKIDYKKIMSNFQPLSSGVKGKLPFFTCNSSTNQKKRGKALSSKIPEEEH